MSHCWRLLAQDQFSGSGNLEDQNGRWSKEAAVTATVGSGLASFPGSTCHYVMRGVVPRNVSDVAVEVDITGALNGMLAMRYINTQNFLFWQYQAGLLVKRVANSDTTITGSVPAVIGTHTVRMEMVGENVALYSDNLLQWAYRLTSAEQAYFMPTANLADVGYGLRGSSSTPTFDNFRLWARTDSGIVTPRRRGRR